MQIKRINDTQISNAIDLIWATFIQFEAPDYSEEGIQSFKDFIENREMIKTLERVKRCYSCKGRTETYLLFLCESTVS